MKNIFRFRSPSVHGGIKGGLLIAILCILCFTTTPSQAATFYFSWYADTASASTVKLIKTGKVFADVTDVYTLTWNATDQIYQVSLDDGTFLPEYYRIEDGSGNIVVEQFYLTGKAIDGDHVEDIFVRNNADDIMRGALEIRPASGTTNVELLIDNSTTTMQISATDTGSVSTSGHILQLQAASIDLQTSAAGDIAITGILNSSTTNSAVTRASRDSLAGAGWVWDSGNNTIMALRDDVDDLMGTGTFTANDTLTLSGDGGGGSINLNWNFDPAGVQDSVEHYEIYYSSSALAGYSQSGAAALSSATLSQIRSNMSRMGLPDRTATATTFLTIHSYYFIIVGFDHTSPTALAWGSNQVLVTGDDDAIDINVPLVGGSDVVAAVGTLANEIDNLKSQTGNSGLVKPLWVHENHAQASSVTLSDFYNVATAASTNIIVAFKKTSLWDGLRLSCQGRHSQAAGDKCTVSLVCSSLSVSQVFLTTSAVDAVLELDCSSLADGQYYATMTIVDSDNNTNDTAYVYYPTIEAFNN